MSRWRWPLAALALLVVIALLAMLEGVQRRFVYFPDQHVPPPPAGIQEVIAQTGDGLRLRGWLSAADADGPLLLVFHGNGGDHADRLPLAEALRPHGISVLLAGYRGYGGNPGTPSEAGLAADARAWQERAAQEERPLVYFGESLGAAVATGLAAESPPAALVLRSPFESLPAVGRHHMPLLPLRWLLHDRYDVVNRIGEVRGPVLVVAGTADQIVPSSQSRAVYEAATAPKRWLAVPGADHNDGVLLDGPDLIAAVRQLLQG